LHEEQQVRLVRRPIRVEIGNEIAVIGGAGSGVQKLDRQGQIHQLEE
jgi:hypothetical protein